MILASEIKALTGQDFDQDMIDTWLANIEVLASDCLNSLDVGKKEQAKLNLLAHFLILNGQDGQGQIVSESLGDTSWTFKSANQVGSKSTQFGAIAKALAPCLGAVMGDKQYGAVRLIR